MTTFFSVDVETSATNIFEGELLTVGAWAVRDGQLIGNYYVRIAHEGVRPRWEPSTRKWWDEQDDFVKGEAFADRTLERVDSRIAAWNFVEWVEGCEPGDRRERVFVANPSTFDWGWVQQWLFPVQQHEVFDYRTCCLRSMAFGQTRDWSARVRTHESEHPHHALYDAKAQALDLIELLREPDPEPPVLEGDLPGMWSYSDFTGGLDEVRP